MGAVKPLTALAILSLFVAGCRGSGKQSGSGLKDFSSPNATMRAYFSAFENVDMDGVVACLADPGKEDQQAAIDEMVDGCPFLVLSQGRYAEPVDAETKAYFDEIVSGIIPASDLKVSYEGDRATAIFATHGGASTFVLRRVGGQYKIDCRGSFSGHYDPGAVQPDHAKAREQLRRLRALKERIDAGDYRRIEDAAEAVKALGFDVA